MRRAAPFLMLLLAAPALAQERFPRIAGELADGTPVELPGEGGRPLVIGLAVSAKAQADLEGWFEPAYLRFVARHGLFAKTHQAEAWFVPLFTGLNKAAYEPSLKRFRRSAAPEVAQRVVFAKPELDALRDALGISDASVPYFFVVDRQGRIVHRASGKHTDAKLDALEEALFGL